MHLGSTTLNVFRCAKPYYQSRKIPHGFRIAVYGALMAPVLPSMVRTRGPPVAVYGALIACVTPLRFILYFFLKNPPFDT